MPNRRAPEGAPAVNPHHVADEGGTVTCELCSEEVEGGECNCEWCGGCADYVQADDVCANCDRCTGGCCNCIVCNNCNERQDNDEICSNCEECQDCCTCIQCEGCSQDRSQDNICGICRRCYEVYRQCCRCVECSGCNGIYGEDEVCHDCDRCIGCRCECETPRVPTSTDGTPTPPPEIGTDADGNQGALPFDTTGGAVEGCACNTCNADRARHRQYLQAGVPPPQRSNPPPETRGYACGIHFKKRHIKFWAGEASPMVPHTRFAAVEIEVLKATNSEPVNAACEKWAHTVVQDGSLPCSTGYELTTSPASGGALHEMIAETCEALKTARATVDKRCGLHVHADSRDLDHRALWRFVRIYQKVEPALYAVVTADRFQNHYCQPCGWGWEERLRRVEKDDPDWLARSLSGMTSKYSYSQKEVDSWKASAKRNKGSCRLYDGLNIGSHPYRGTIECRIHHGSTDADKILPWTVLWAGLVQRAKEMTDEQVEELPGEPIEPQVMDRWDKTAWKALEKLAPTAAIRAWLRTRRRQFADLAKATAKAPKKSKNGEI